MVQLVARMTAVRGALQDHLEDNPVIYSGVAALLDFTAQICRKLKSTVLGAGSGDLQMLLVQVCNGVHWQAHHQYRPGPQALINGLLAGSRPATARSGHRKAFHADQLRGQDQTDEWVSIPHCVSRESSNGPDL